jgi:hypothetical protein
MSGKKWFQYDTVGYLAAKKEKEKERQSTTTTAAIVKLIVRTFLFMVNLIPKIIV